MLEVIEGNEPLPRWLPPYLHGLFATGPQLGWQAGEPSVDVTARRDPEQDQGRTRRSSTTSRPCQRAAHPRPGRRLVPVDGDGGVAGNDRHDGRGRCGRARCRRGRDGHDVAGGDRRGGKWADSGANGQGSVLRCRQRCDHRGAPRRAGGYEGFSAIGSGMGSAGSSSTTTPTCMVDAAYRLSRFLSVESCGQCPPCKLGSGAITEHLERIETGRRRLSTTSTGSSDGWVTSPMATGATSRPRSRSWWQHPAAFPEEFAQHLEPGRARRPRRLPIPKLLDLADGHATYDESFWRKRPDWTYGASEET